MVRGERDLAGADEVEVVALELVDLGACAPRKPVPSIASGRTSAGAITGVKPGRDRLRHRQVDQRQLEQRADAGQEVEPRAADLRAALGVDRAERRADVDVVADLEVVRRHLPDRLDDDRVGLAADRRLRLDQVADRVGRRPQRDVGLGLLGLGLLDRRP